METAERSVFGLIDCNNTDDDKVRDIKRAPKNCVLAAVSCVEADIRSFSLRFGEVALFSSLLGDLLEFGAGLSACLGFIMAPFGSFFLLLLLCVVASEPHTTLHHGRADSAKHSSNWTGNRAVTQMRLGLPPLQRHSPFSEQCSKTNRNKNKQIKECAPSVGKTCAVGFVVVWIIGELWAADASKCPRAYGKNASSGQKFGCANYTRFFKTSFGQQNKKKTSVGKKYSYSFLLCFASFVVCLFIFVFHIFDFPFFLFLSFPFFSLPFSCLFHSCSSLHFPSNLQKAAKGKKTMNKKQHQQQEEDKREKITGGKTKNENKCKNQPPPPQQKKGVRR